MIPVRTDINLRMKVARALGIGLGYIKKVEIWSNCLFIGIQKRISVIYRFYPKSILRPALPTKSGLYHVRINGKWEFLRLEVWTAFDGATSIDLKDRQTLERRYILDAFDGVIFRFWNEDGAMGKQAVDDLQFQSYQFDTRPLRSTSAVKIPLGSLS